MDEKKIESKGVDTSDVSIKTDGGEKSEDLYPSACLLLEHCFRDYQRLQESYDKIYQKINTTLAFVGIVLTIIVGLFDFSEANLSIKEMTVGELLLLSIQGLCSFGSVLLLIGAVVSLLILMKGSKITVFNSEDVRNEELYRLKETQTAVWLIDKYTTIVHDVRPTIKKKQQSFDRILIAIVTGIILYTVSIFLKGAL